MWKFVILIVILFSLLGCDGRTLNPEDAKHAWLHVLYNNSVVYEEVLDAADENTSISYILPDDSECQLDKYYFEIQASPDSDIYYSYRVITQKDGYYSTYQECGKQDTIIVNANVGFSPVSSGLVCGMLLDTYIGPYGLYEFYVLQDSLIIDSLTTTANGYFAIDIPFGEYQITFKDMCVPEDIYEEFIVDSFYKDYYVYGHIWVAKPNIYIYPEEKMDLDVSIIFPHGGNVTTSIPEYGDGWKNLSVEPSGRINNEFTFLFYESSNPDLFQYSSGWLIPNQELETFFTSNLAETGFEGQEIIDFTDYWIPLLTDYPYYAIYPQYNDQLSRMVELEFSVQPGNVLRLIYSIEGQQNDSLVLHKPIIPEFKREGFFVVEWGVSLRKETLLSSNK